MTIWLISDTHFGHANIIEYCGRPFASADEMDEALVDNWNRVVGKRDHVYHLGDVAMRAQHLRIVKRLNGELRLVPGNHDVFKTRQYLDAGFKEIKGARVLDGLVLSHFPVHPATLDRFRGNVHGHIHNLPSPAGPYLNVSVEAINYTPITLEEAAARVDRVRATDWPCVPAAS